MTEYVFNKEFKLVVGSDNNVLEHVKIQNTTEIIYDMVVDILSDFVFDIVVIEEEKSPAKMGLFYYEIRVTLCPSIEVSRKLKPIGKTFLFTKHDIWELLDRGELKDYVERLISFTFKDYWEEYGVVRGDKKNE